MYKSWTIFVGLAAIVAFSALAEASIQVGDRIRFTDKYGSTGGGEFGVHQKLSASPAGGNAQSGELFRSFCIERNEFIDFSTYGFVVDSISKSAMNGGFAGGNPDPISQQTAWLFYNFTKGTLAGYSYAGGAAQIASANQLQNAIWFLEQEISLSNAQQAANAFLVAANAASVAELQAAYARTFVLNIKWATDRSGLDGVYEHNGSWSAPGAGDNGQSQLYVIPEPGTVLVWSALSLLGLGVYRRFLKLS